MTISARTLLLDLFTNGQNETLTSRDLARVGAAFGFAEEAIRTALARLRAEGRLTAVRRGVYGPGPVSDPIRDRVSVWWTRPGRRLAWDGSWIMTAIRPTSLTRTLWRRCQWSLEFNGFRQDASGIWVRPNNLTGGFAGVREDLSRFGAPHDMLVGRLDGISPAQRDRFAALWDTEGLRLSHEAYARSLDQSRAGLGSGPDAAVTTLLVGREAIRRIIRDPQLPRELADDAPLLGLVDAMIAYDRVGRRAWAQFLGGAAPTRPEPDYER